MTAIEVNTEAKDLQKVSNLVIHMYLTQLKYSSVVRAFAHGVMGRRIDPCGVDPMIHLQLLVSHTNYLATETSISMYLSMYVLMYICMYVYLYVCMYICMYVYLYVCMYLSIYVSLYVCMYVSMYLCMYLHCLFICSIFFFFFFFFFFK